MTKPMGMRTLYMMRLDIEKLISKAKKDLKSSDDLHGVFHGCNLLLESYKLELKYRDQIGCSDEMEFFAAPWRDDKTDKSIGGGDPK